MYARMNELMNVQGVTRPIISLDANFGLVRKHSSGGSAGPAQHGERYFVIAIHYVFHGYVGTISLKHIMQAASCNKVSDDILMS